MATRESPATVRTPVGRPPVPRSLAVAAGWSWRLLVVAAAGALVVWLLVRLRIVVLPVVLAMLVTAVLAPPARWLRRHGWPRLLATWTVLLGALLTLAGVIAGLSWQTAESSDDLDVNVDQGIDDVKEWLVDGPLGLSRQRVNEVDEQARDWISSSDGLISSVGADQATLALEVLAGLLLTIVLVFFFLHDGDRIWGWITRRMGDGAGPHVDAAGRRAWSALGGFVRGTAIVATVDAVLIGLAIAFLGVPLVFPLVALTFIGGFLPLVGAVVAGAVAVLVALATKGFVTALILLAVVVAVQQIEGNILQPVVMSRAVSLHPIAILLAVGAGTAVGGVVGAFLAVPTAAAGAAVAGYAWARVGPDKAGPGVVREE
jgi:predicted PurR-regulated permease PerM